jgi:hypothetical protein
MIKKDARTTRPYQGTRQIEIRGGCHGISRLFLNMPGYESRLSLRVAHRTSVHHIATWRCAGFRLVAEIKRIQK